MKKMKIISLLSFILLSFLIINCRHELPFPVETCADVNFKIAASKTDATLNTSNGSITVTASGGKDFVFSLNGSPYTNVTTYSGLAPFSVNKIKGKNSLGCIDSLEVTIGSNDPCQGVVITVTTTKVDAGAGQSNGSITATATGPLGLTYSINGGPFQASPTFSNLPMGNYTIAAKSPAGCIGLSPQVTVGTIDPCAGINILVTTTLVQPTTGQSNGSIVAAATGGNGFTYSLNNGAYQASGTFINLAAGNYTITAKNATGCVGVTQATLTSVDPCAGVTILVNTTQVNPTTGQSNGTITATATGSAGFTYSLNGGAYQASNIFTGLATGNYTVTAKNANGCTGVAQVALGSTNPCAGVTVTVTTTQVNPTTGNANGSITAAATGGTGFTYSLNNGTFQAGATFSNLAAGSYTVTAKNSNGCLGSVIVALVAIDPCAGVVVNVTSTQIDPTTGNTNGSITATATGGTGFTYSLNNGAYQASGTFSNLAAGTYTITAKSSLGCLGTKVVTLTAVSPCTNVNIVINQTVVNNTPCVTALTGSITITATGSTGFTYNKNGGVYQASNIFSALAAGTYLIGVKDANGCTNTKSIVVGLVPQGPNFAQVRTLITAKCGGNGCHLNGQTTAGYNFDADCSIVTRWSQINGSCVTGTLITMPLAPLPPLSAAEKLLITNWVTAGHRYTD
jgi:SprB repeat